MNAIFRDAFYANTSEEFDEDIWKKHPQETAEAYDYFIRYYVTEEKSIEAYRLFLYDKGVLSKDDFPNIRRPAQKFSNYEKGWNEAGKDIKGLPSFDERKKAFALTGLKPPPRLIETSIDDVKNLRVAIVKQELLDAEVLHQQWLLQLAMFKEQVDEQKAEGTRANNTNSLVMNNLLKARKEISFLQRRAAGMTDKAEDDILEEAVEQEVEIVYEEVEIDVKQFEPIDFATLESFDAIINQDNYEEIVERLTLDEKDKKEES